MIPFLRGTHGDPRLVGHRIGLLHFDHSLGWVMICKSGAQDGRAKALTGQSVT